MKRQRGRTRRSGTGNNTNRSMESNGPDVKVRGSAKQIFEKYETLCRDAATSGNRIKSENLRQHAEHYLRIVNEHERVKQVQREEAANTEAVQNGAGKSSGPSGGGNQADQPDREAQSSGGKRPRRYPPQTRRTQDADKPSADKPSADKPSADKPSADKQSKAERGDSRPAEQAMPEGLEMVTPETPAASKSTAAKPTRRRKAPAKDEAAGPDDSAPQAKPAEAAS